LMSAAGAQQLADPLSKRPPILAAQGHQRVQDDGGTGLHSRRLEPVKQSRLGGAAEIQDAVSNGHAYGTPRASVEHSERKVLNWEIGARPIGRLYPTGQLGVVRLANCVAVA